MRHVLPKLFLPLMVSIWFVQLAAMDLTATQPVFKFWGESASRLGDFKQPVLHLSFDAPSHSASTPTHNNENKMAYSEEIKQTTKNAPKTLGNQLGRWAIHLDFPVIEVAKFTGATRQTVYNWFSGTEVTQSYRTRVQSLLNILQNSKTAEEALRQCNKNT